MLFRDCCSLRHDHVAHSCGETRWSSVKLKTKPLTETFFRSSDENFFFLGGMFCLSCLVYTAERWDVGIGVKVWGKGPWVSPACLRPGQGWSSFAVQGHSRHRCLECRRLWRHSSYTKVMRRKATSAISISKPTSQHTFHSDFEGATSTCIGLESTNPTRTWRSSRKLPWSNYL